MKQLVFVTLFILIANGVIYGQTIDIKPYLQEATPNSICIMWQTTEGTESIVEWGLTDTLGNITEGTNDNILSNDQVHTVKIEGLDRFTKYFYQVKTGPAVSAIYNFKTPPFSSDNQSFRIVSMSDMQQDFNFPDKYEEVVNDGVLDYLEDEFGGELIDNLAMVLIPGDLVDNGNNYNSWKETFFNPSENLFTNVPVYPAIGNHEDNSIFYFKYFNLPDNGVPGYEEHSYYMDYGNVRIIGMDSNPPYDTQDQLDWLGVVLQETCSIDSIDFVFAQLHHPHRSELWTPGNTDYTGEVIEILGDFSTDCGKPSIHFFGHTHAYSRGHSRDHKHLMVNVASAGGAVDNWGEFPNYDYEEYAISDDGYGFVVVDVTNDDNPTVVVKRITRGDQDVVIDNELVDSVVMRKNYTAINTPIPEFPVDVTIVPECVTLKANSFSSSDSVAQHGQSHWQVAVNSNAFSNPLAESWRNFENWYFEENTQAEDDLSDEFIQGLDANQTYWWRVRYRDRELNWSAWSDVVSFTTIASSDSPNLVLNPGAEDGLDNWTITQGIVEELVEGQCDGISPHSGNSYFGVGGICDESEVGKCIQNVDVSLYADSIDGGSYAAKFGAYFSDYSGNDLPEMRIQFFDENNIYLGVSSTISSFSSSWILLTEWTDIPVGTRSIRVELKGTRYNGADNDSYIDDVFLKVGAGVLDCSPAIINGISRVTTPIQELSISPNPISSTSLISIFSSDYSSLKLSVVDSNGNKVFCSTQVTSEGILINKGDLSSGTYFFNVRDKGVVVGQGKFVVL